MKWQIARRKIVREVFPAFKIFKANKTNLIPLRNHERGLTTLRDLFSALAFSETKTWLSFGALLAIIRNKRVEPPDGDFDIAVLDRTDFEVILSNLQKFNFEPTLVYRLDGEIKFFKVCRGPYSIDIYRAEKFEEMLISRWYAVTSEILFLEPKDEVGQVTFGDVVIPIPAHAERHLAFLYGEKWRIPNSNWHFILKPDMCYAFRANLGMLLLFAYKMLRRFGLLTVLKSMR